MRAVIQRCTKSSVVVDSNTVGEIGLGLFVLLGVEENDTKEDGEWLLRKILNMRIFSDEEGKMNQSLLDVSGELLIVSQFTLHASTKKGNRPSFIRSARPEQAEALYEEFIASAKSEGISVATGIFGAHMEINLVNDGPVTIIMDSKNKE